MLSDSQIGDKLIITKPLGTGIVSTALKGGKAGEEAVAHITASMITLNKIASELMIEAGAHACTDITGFGLLGHACGMIENSMVGIEFNIAAIPLFPEVRGFAEMGLIPGGTHRNKEFRLNMIEQASMIGDDMWNVLFDPQTSGGLLLSIASADAYTLLENLHRHGIEDAAIIGEVIEEPRGRITIRE